MAGAVDVVNRSAAHHHPIELHIFVLRRGDACYGNGLEVIGGSPDRLQAEPVTVALRWCGEHADADGVQHQLGGRGKLDALSRQLTVAALLVG